MINSNTLDTIIAVVITLLILSLIVQSIQSILKKLLKIKSRQIEESLVDLFKNVLNKQSEGLTGRLAKLIDHSPMLGIVFRRGNWLHGLVRRYLPAAQTLFQARAAERAGVADIYDRVMQEFGQVGRLAQSGSNMLDSIAKDDLLRILDKVPVTQLLDGNFLQDVRKAFDGALQLEKDLMDVKKGVESGRAASEFAALSAEYTYIQVALTPFFNDVRGIVRKIPAAGGAPPPNATHLLVGDIAALRGIEPEELLHRLAGLQIKINQLQGNAGLSQDVKGALADLQTRLAKISGGIRDLRLKLDAVVSSFKAKLSEVNKWYDTVMQGFEERYNRSMKSWAIVIAFFVVVLLNANFFNIYQNLASSDVTRNLIVQQGGQILQRSKDQTAAGTGDEDKAKKEQSIRDLKDEIEKIKKDANLFAGVGLSPLRVQQVRDWLSSWIPPEPLAIKGWIAWLASRKHDLVVLIGWMIMTVLLSIGAPFWQDTLESLFGVKNLLRKKADIKNVEQESGAGQPKP